MLKNLKFSTEEYVLGGVAAFILAILLMGSCGGGGAKTPEDLGKKVFEAVKKNDQKAIEKLTVTVADLEYMLDNADLPEDAKAKGKEEIKDKEKQMKEDFARFWDFTISSIKSYGIDQAQLEMGTPTAELETRGKLEAAKITVPVSQGSIHGNLMVAGFKHGQWRLMPPVQFHEAH